MYTVLENARIVISLLKQHNIRHIVLSPGGSNIPIVQGVQQDSFFKCYSVVDERSAMYFAIGIYLQTGEPVATSCTSAQATRNYLPGLTEAYYKHVPILAITMSKHPMYLSQDYMQCPIQTSLPVDSVKKSFSLPCINTENDRAQCIRTANEAMLELTHHGTGPVQLNIEELDSQTWTFDENITELPKIRCIKRYCYWDKISAEDISGKKVMVVIGEHLPFTEKQKEAIEKFASTNNVFIYTDHTSNYRGKYAINANIAVATITPALFLTEYKPDVVISIGGLTGDYGIYKKLFVAPAGSFEHWRVALDGNVVDTYNKLTRVYEMQEEDFFTGMIGAKEASHSYFDSWKSYMNGVNYNIDLPLSNLYAATKLCSMIPEGSYMNYAILNSLRVWNYVQIPADVQSFSNLAAFGIDGCMSTAFGQSVCTDKLTFHITGDLAYFYDMNAMGIRHIGNNVRVLLCNNNGGMEFKFGPLRTRTDVGSYIAADNHFKNTKGWAETSGFIYISAHTKEELDNALPAFVQKSDKPIIIEIFTNPDNERDANNALTSGNWHGTKDEVRNKEIKDSVKNVTETLFGEYGVKIIKKIVGK